MPSDRQFVHLHAHSSHSMLDGLALIPDMVAEAERLGQPAIAVTDHGTMAATYDLYKATQGSSVKGIYGCLLAGQEIVTSRGVKNVECVEVGDLVLTHKGRFRRVIRTMTRVYEGQGYIVHLNGRASRTLTLTEEHPILVRHQDGSVDWRLPGEILVGRRNSRMGANNWNSYVCLPKLVPSSEGIIHMLDYLPPDFRERDGRLYRTYESKYRSDEVWHGFPSALTLSPEFAYFLGLYAAEGSISKTSRGITGGINLTLHYSETALAARADEFLTQVGLTSTIYDRADYNSTIHYQVNCLPLALLLDQLVGSGAKDKVVPAEILSASPDVKKAFTDGLLDGDGKNPNRESNPNGRRNLKTASRSLAWGLRTLLIDRGYWASVGTGEETITFPQGHGGTYRYFSVSYSPNRAYSRTIEDAEYVYRPVRNIVPIHLATQVFNFEVEEDNSYVSDFILHNCEVYLSPDVPRSHREAVRWANGGDDDVSGAGAYTHMTMLAATDEGLKNLFRISSESYLTGQYRKPRADVDLLTQFGSGIVATTGCPSGEVQTWLRIGNYEKAVAAAAKFRDLFDDGHFYVEVMDHGLDIEKRVIKDLLRLAKDLNLPVVATNDLHYVHHGDAATHDALLCVSAGANLADMNRFRFDGSGYYLKSASEMRGLWDREVPDACNNTLLIAEQCNATFVEGQNLMPQFPVPDGWTEAEWFAREVREGVKRRYPEGVPQDRRERTDYEIDVITKMGFAGYFLVVADFINWAKQQGIRVGPGRGSAAGSIVAYGLGITELDPIENGLLFERFLNPERVSPPDIDIDFDDRRRGEVIEYVRRKYGEDKVAHIATFGTIKAKAAIKDSARVLGLPYALSDRLTKAYPPPIVGRDLSLKGAYDAGNDRYNEAADFRALVQSEPEAQKVVELAKGLEGVKRGFGMHAAGVLMSREPLVEHVPLMKRDADSPVMTQFEYPTCENLGLIKMDFLGLSNLYTIDQAFRMVHDNRGITLDLDTIWSTKDDAVTYDLLASGETLGVFQLDSPPIRSLLRLMKPDQFNDVSAVLALYRPGPMGAGAHIDYADRKNGRKPVVPIHPEFAESLKDILEDTHGLIVYQEQVMSIAQTVAGYTLGQADLLRRAMGKKKKEILDKEYAPFAEAARRNGYSDAAIKALWDVLVPFSDYAFNRAHSAAYGYISYATAYLKANFPAEFMAALLTTNSDDKDKTALYLAECRRMGVDVLPPDVNESDANYTAVGDAVRVGLVSIRHVGAKAVEGLLRTRAEHGRFTSFGDFLTAVPTETLNRRLVESLIAAGAFDSFGHTRNALDSVHEEAVKRAVAAKKKQVTDQDSLFDLASEGVVFTVDIPNLPEWERNYLLAKEREMLGLYVSDHPLTGVGHLLRQVAPRTITEVKESASPDGGDGRVAGLITAVQNKRTKKGDAYVVLTVEDLDSSIPVYVFPRVYSDTAHLIGTDRVVRIDGKVEKRDDGSVSMTATRLSPVNLHDLANPDAVPLVLRCSEHNLTPDVVARLKEVFTDFAGPTPIELRLTRPDGTGRVLALGSDWTVERKPGLISGIKAVLGIDSIAGGLDPMSDP